MHASPSLQTLESAKVAWLQPVCALQPSLVQGLLSSQPTGVAPLHVPPPHTSPLVHMSPSLHAAVLAVCAQPLLVLQLSLVQGLLSSQLSRVPALHAPPTQPSGLVQALPSLQLPSELLWLQPAMGSQLSLVQGLLSSHTVGAPPWQVPPAQESPLVQGLPSLHGWVLAAWLQPSLASQASLVHGFWSSQLGAAPGLHTPAVQVSPTVQALPSSQVPAAALCRQPLVLSQLSAVHGLLSLQLTVAPAWHTPPPQRSPTVQVSPSLQVAVVAVWVQPLCGAQPSAVQGLLSSQPSTAVPLQVPPLQVSLSEQALPSSQGRVVAAWAQPVLALQLSAVHRFWSSQPICGPLTHTPFMHASLSVHTLPSSQLAMAFRCLQPTAESQVSAVHGLLSSQGAVLPAQLPAVQASLTVHGLPSSQLAKLAVWPQPVLVLHVSLVQGFWSSQPPVVQTMGSVQRPPLGTSTWLHPACRSQVSVVQGLPSSQSPPTPKHRPAVHASLLVHALPSLQVPLAAVCTQPKPFWHASLVHGLLSSQPMLPVALHTPPVQVSPVLQLLPSLQPA